MTRALDGRGRRISLLLGFALFAAHPAFAQGTTPAKPDDTPSIKVGAVVFADYTFQTTPTSTDAQGNAFHPNSFNVTRTYINIQGSVSHNVSFRITPDIQKETGTGSALNGSSTFRLKYGFLEFNLADWMTKGSFIRVGLQQTPWIDYAEGIYRYRFQGPTFADRQGLFPSSDFGVTMHYNFKSDYGDVHFGMFNGEGYNKFETNQEKAFEFRGTLRPLAKGSAAAKGWRVATFIDADDYIASGPRRRYLIDTTYEHPHVNLGADFVAARDQTLSTATLVKGSGWDIWITPIFKKKSDGPEALLRFDQFEPNTAVSGQKQRRAIVGFAYWFPHGGGPTSALMLDYENDTFPGFANSGSTATTRKIAVHFLFNY